ncbi:metal iron transporter [Pseudohyphozyma bogoriensis]|nr:metal iron transporter [Pseudohyphozyma bogoriensis]
MQGPRQPSHSAEIDLADVLPPRKKLAPSPVARQDERDDDGDDDKPPKTPWWTKIKRHAAFVGPGVIASVAYIDPGNWATDLQAGSQYGYAHLFVVLLAGLIALLFQILATRLGSVSGNDLSEHCRLAFHDRPTRKLWWRWGVLYPLYALSEIAIIFTDLAELLGSAIAINLLIPKIPLWGAVVLTSVDVFLVLLLFSQYPTKLVTRSMRLFEAMIGLLVLCVLGSFVALLVKVSPVWKDVFHGYVPGPGFIRGGGLYVAVGIVGATCMPHAFYLGSKMATMRRLVPESYESDDSTDKFFGMAFELERVDSPPQRAQSSEGDHQIHLHFPQPVTVPSSFVAQRPQRRQSEDGKKVPTGPAEKPTLKCVQAHLGHAVADVAGSLLGFAILINSSILILSAAVFYYGDGRSSSGTGVSDLFDAYALVKDYIGQAFAYLFAVALLAAGQSASLTVTLSGQVISEGFIEWHTTPWKRRLITRMIGIIPSVAVAAAVGRQGLDVLLVGSQVALSIVLPFVMAPLIYFTTKQDVMSIPKDSRRVTPLPEEEKKTLLQTLNPWRRRRGPEGWVSFANGTFIVYLAWTLWVLVVTANIYALYDLGAGES